MTKLWKRGRGKLGFLDPVLGSWVASSESPRGPVRCRRSLARVLGNSYVRLDAHWEFGATRGQGGPGGSPQVYEEIALIGIGDDKSVWFWSYTSDGKRSQGPLRDVTDLHPEAFGFEAQMPAGVARMAYWPVAPDAFIWVVESRARQGWNRFTEHRYERVV